MEHNTAQHCAQNSAASTPACRCMRGGLVQGQATQSTLRNVSRAYSLLPRQVVPDRWLLFKPAVVRLRINKGGSCFNNTKNPESGWAAHSFSCIDLTAQHGSMALTAQGGARSRVALTKQDSACSTAWRSQHSMTLTVQHGARSRGWRSQQRVALTAQGGARSTAWRSQHRVALAAQGAVCSPR